MAPSVSIRPASNFIERCAAWRIVHQRYVQSGFIGPSSTGLHFSLLDLLPSSECWTVHAEGRVRGTMSAVYYSSAGIPSGPTFEADLRRFGVDGRLVCEFTKCAIDESVDASQAVAVDLTGAMIASAWSRGVDDVICVVHPDHARVWTHVYGWKALGEVRGHSGVRGNPGVLLAIDLRALDRSFSVVPRRGRSIILSHLEGASVPTVSTIRPSGPDVLSLLLQRPDVMLKAPPLHRRVFLGHYPWIAELLQPVWFALATGWSNVVPIPNRPKVRPAREPSLLFPSEQLRLLHHATSELPVDRLLEPDAPLVLVVDGGQSFRRAALRAIEEQNFIPVRVRGADDAGELFRSNLFDAILNFDPQPTSEWSRFVELVRGRDTASHTHTPIFDVPSLLGERTLLLGQVPQDSAQAELRCVQELFRALGTVRPTKEPATGAEITLARA